MKKILLYVLVLIVLFGALVPLVSVDASVVNPNEPCNGVTADTSTNRPCIPANGTNHGAPSACSTLSGIGKVICQLHQILNLAIPFIITLGLIYFIWGVVQYVIGGGDEAKKKGRDHIIYGLIGLAAIVGVWGLVNIVVRTFNLTGSVTVTSLVPAAQSSCSTLPAKAKFQDLLCYLTNIINSAIVPFIFSLAFVSFIWGVVQFVINSEDESKKTKGKQFMLWGIIALTVMVSVWGLVNILGTTFNISGSFLPQVKP